MLGCDEVEGGGCVGVGSGEGEKGGEEDEKCVKHCDGESVELALKALVEVSGDVNEVRLEEKIVVLEDAEDIYYFRYHR